MFCDPENVDESVWTFDSMMPGNEGAGQLFGAERAPTPAKAPPARLASGEQPGGAAQWEEAAEAPVVVDWASDLGSPAEFDTKVEAEEPVPWYAQSSLIGAGPNPSEKREPRKDDQPFFSDTSDADDFGGLMPSDMFMQAGSSSSARGTTAGWGQPAAAAGGTTRVGKASASGLDEAMETTPGGTPLDLLSLDLELDENWGRTSSGTGSSGGTDTPPPPNAEAEEQAPDNSLNCDELFSDRNFKKGTSGLSERGRGAFAAAVICLLERGGTATGHVHVIRGGAHVDCWQLNRMPGRTDACLRFVNQVLVSILGLKAFSSWRALARSLGDTRDYLPPRHWKCLELKGGGVSDATKQPWQSYRARAGHFDRLATELESVLLSCGDLLSSQGKAVAPTAAAPVRKVKSRQEQFATKRATVLAAEGAKAQSSSDGYKTKGALKSALQNTWAEVLLLMPTPRATSARSRTNATPRDGSRGKAATTYGDVKYARASAGWDDRLGGDFYSPVPPQYPTIKAEPGPAVDGSITSKSRSGRSMKSPKWMKEGSSFLTGDSMNDEIHQAGARGASASAGLGGVKSGTQGGGGGAVKRRRRGRSRSPLGAAAAAAMFM